MRMTKSRGPRMTRLRARLRRAEREWTRNSIKRKSFALIRVIRGQICFSLLFPGGMRCPQRVGNAAVAAGTLAPSATFLLIVPPRRADPPLQSVAGDQQSQLQPTTAPSGIRAAAAEWGEVSLSAETSASVSVWAWMSALP
jgi:hypothetical protein